MKVYLSDHQEGKTPFRLCALPTVPSVSCAHACSLHGSTCSGPSLAANTKEKPSAPFPYVLKIKRVLNKIQKCMYLKIKIDFLGFLIPFKIQETKIFLVLRWPLHHGCFDLVCGWFAFSVTYQCLPPLFKIRVRCNFLLKAVNKS